MENNYAKEQNKIAEGTVFTGDIESQGNFRIDGKVQGNLKVKGKVVIGETGQFIGDIECADADFAGIFDGTLQVKNNLTLKASCSVNGEINTAQLQVEPGANLNGSCSMKGAVKSLEKNEPKQKAQEKKGKIA